MASSSTAVAAIPPHAAALPVYRPLTRNELLKLEVKANLVPRMGLAEDFGWLTTPLVQVSYSKCFAATKKAAANVFLNELLHDCNFRAICVEAQSLRRNDNSRLVDWKVSPFARMRLCQHLEPGHMAVPYGEVVDESRAIHVILVPTKELRGGPHSVPVSSVDGVEVRDVRNEAAQMHLPLALVEDSSGSYPILRILQQLAKEKHWEAFRSLTENAVGAAMRLTDLLGQTISWSDELSSLRGPLDAIWRERAQEAGRFATRLYAEEMLGVQTMKSRFIKCDFGCNERLDIDTKNLTQFELGYACRRRPLSTLRVCPQCQRRGYQIKYFMLSQPALLAYHFGALEFGDIEQAFANYEMDLPVDDDNVFDLYAAVVAGKRVMGEGLGRPFVLLQREGAWHRACSGLSLTWDTPFNYGVDCAFGLAVLLAVYVRR